MIKTRASRREAERPYTGRTVHGVAAVPFLVPVNVRGALLGPTQQLPRPSEQRLRLKPDSLWRGAPWPAPTCSVGRGSDRAYGHLSVQPCRSVRVTSGAASAQRRYFASEGAPDVQHHSHETLPMKGKSTLCPGRQRCMGCGHPNSEHLGREECTVPQCACLTYQQPKQRSA